MSNEASQHATLHIEGMSCEHCAKRVEQALTTVPGVQAARVDLGNKAAMVTFGPKASVSGMMRVVGEAGYSATGFTRG